MLTKIKKAKKVTWLLFKTKLIRNSFVVVVGDGGGDDDEGGGGRDYACFKWKKFFSF